VRGESGVLLDREHVVEWGCGVEIVAMLGGGFFFGDEGVAGKGVGVHVSSEHYLLVWGGALAVFATEEEEG